MALLPSELRELVDALSAWTQTVESNLDLCCASSDVVTVKRIPPEEYIVVQPELEMLAVKRFQILERKRQTDNYDNDDAASYLSVRGISGVLDDNPDDDNVEDDAYKRFLLEISNGIINRISM
ncbi:hypothetical protein DPMN_070213 [Dreissena polymorpha]|uniref:Uncharacterized protein n=1 Tax=Dreissena polymorpha TaxID=45954 RepID=A0A9D4BUY6_DREPO|nr:hypothetical protein DPMN_070213 [Dreissena polymorpha]